MPLGRYCREDCVFNPPARPAMYLIERNKKMSKLAIDGGEKTFNGAFPMWPTFNEKVYGI